MPCRYIIHTIPYQIIPHRSISYHTPLYHTAPSQTALYRTVPYSNVPYRTVSYCTVTEPTVPHRMVRYRIVPVGSCLVKYQEFRWLRGHLYCTTYRYTVNALWNITVIDYKSYFQFWLSFFSIYLSGTSWECQTINPNSINNRTHIHSRIKVLM